MSEMKVGDTVIVEGNAPIGQRILVKHPTERYEHWWATVVGIAENAIKARLLFTTTGIKPFFVRDIRQHIRQ